MCTRRTLNHTCVAGGWGGDAKKLEDDFQLISDLSDNPNITVNIKIHVI